MRTSATAAIDSYACLIHVLTVVPHIVEKDECVQHLHDMSTVGTMKTFTTEWGGWVCLLCFGTYLSLTLSVGIKVKIDTDSSHACQCCQSLLLVGTAARHPMTVGTDNEWVLAFCCWRIDRTEDVFTWKRLYTDVLYGVTIVFSYFRQDGLAVDKGVEVAVYL